MNQLFKSYAKTDYTLWTHVLSCILCLALCDPMNCSPPGSSVHGILQARILEWVAMSSSHRNFLTQGSNPHLLWFMQAESSLLNHLGSPYLNNQLVKSYAKIDHNWYTSVQLQSRIWLFVAPWTAACQASLSITNYWSLLKLISIELVMPSNHLILCHTLLLLPSIFPSIKVFSNESALPIRWPKYWSFRISPSNECSGLILFRFD